MTQPGNNENRFQDFFEEAGYVALKNHLYNYRLRKRAVEHAFRGESPSRILEVGSGISPVMTKSDRIVYSELSPLACRTLKTLTPQGCHVSADATRLPFAAAAFSHAIASEVIEHIEDDRGALRELERVLRPGGRLILTFPHRRAYFGIDDRYVKHWRRYDWDDIATLLDETGFRPLYVRKVLGPFEKAVMSMAVRCFEGLTHLQASGFRRQASGSAMQPEVWARTWLRPLWAFANTIASIIATFDAWIIPRAWASVLLVVATKKQT